MKNKIMPVCISLSLAFFVVFVSLYIYAWTFDPKLYPCSFRVPLGHASMTVTKLWGGNIVFFSQEAPYTGSTISINQNDHSVSEKQWTGFGVYYRLIKDTHRTDVWWTLMINLWYPIAVCGVPPAVYFIKKWCGRKG